MPARLEAARSEPHAHSTCSSTVPGSASSDGGGSANAAVDVVVVAAAAATGGGGGGGGTVGEAASGACPYRSAALRHASSCAQAALPALTAIAESASATWLGLGLG